MIRLRVWGVLAALWIAASASPGRAAEVVARLERNALGVGESTTLEVAVRGISGSIGDPEFTLPSGLEMLGSARAQSFSWVNGQSSSETAFRYEIGTNATGRFTIGPFRVRAGGQVIQGAAVTLSVAGGMPSVSGSGGRNTASLLVDVTPAHPWVGQPVLLRVRLVLRTPLAEEPNYVPPNTSGFWTENPSRPESYYAQQGGDRVLVTETRSRMVPISAGHATVGEASATLALSVPGSDDPTLWSTGRVPRREITVRSTPVAVDVRSLPAGAPAGFDGAVGGYTVSWSADRSHTSLDVPIVLQLDVRGLGNLALLHSPRLESDDADVFSSTVDDSGGAPGALSAGRRRFQWSVLAHRTGRLRLEPPALAWFDPASATYHRAALAPIVIDVGPATSAGTPDRTSFPGVFSDHPVEPREHAPQPWAFALAGVLLGWAVRLWRGGRPRLETAPSEPRRWLAKLRGGTHEEFWRAADEASHWLATGGRPIGSLAAEIASARYGGASSDQESIRRRLVDQLTAALPTAAPRNDPRPRAIGLAVAALALAVFFGPRFGESREALEVRAGDQAARDGDVDLARATWERLWSTTPHAALAARLAWTEVRAGSIGRAAAWALRGQPLDPRDPALRWVTDRIREAGGLTGEPRRPLPLRPAESAVLALLLGAAAGFVGWSRRALAGLALALSLMCAGLGPAQRWWAERTARAVVLSNATLEGANVDLEPGQVVTVLERAGTRVRVRAGRDISGWLPSSSIEPVVAPS